MLKPSLKDLNLSSKILELEVFGAIKACLKMNY